MNAPQSMIAFLLCGYSVALIVGLLVGAVIVRAACSIYNGLVGGEYTDSGVPSPGFGWAMVIVLVNGIVATAVSFAITFGFAILAREQVLGNGPPVPLWIIMQAISLPIGFLINASLTSIMLPTTFGRSALIVLIEYLIVLLIFAVIAGTLFVVGVTAWRMR